MCTCACARDASPSQGGRHTMPYYRRRTPPHVQGLRYRFARGTRARESVIRTSRASSRRTFDRAEPCTYGWGYAHERTSSIETIIGHRPSDLPTLHYDDHACRIRRHSRQRRAQFSIDIQPTGRSIPSPPLRAADRCRSRFARTRTDGRTSLSRQRPGIASATTRLVFARRGGRRTCRGDTSPRSTRGSLATRHSTFDFFYGCHLTPRPRGVALSLFLSGVTFFFLTRRIATRLTPRMKRQRARGLQTRRRDEDHRSRRRRRDAPRENRPKGESPCDRYERSHACARERVKVKVHGGVSFAPILPGSFFFLSRSPSRLACVHTFAHQIAPSLFLSPASIDLLLNAAVTEHRLSV